MRSDADGLDITVMLRRDRSGTRAAAIYAGSYSRHALRPSWTLVGVTGATQEHLFRSFASRSCAGTYSSCIVLHFSLQR